MSNTTTPYEQDLLERATLGDIDSQYELGMAYYFGDKVKRSKQEALKWVQLAAKSGHAQAAFKLGQYHYHVLRSDDKEYLKWYLLAAERGHPEAQYKVGIRYCQMLGRKRTRTVGLEWLKLAAAQGHVESQYQLGAMFYRGEYLKQSYAKAQKWFLIVAANHIDRKTAQLEYFHQFEVMRLVAPAQYALGVMYYYGLNGKQSYKKALKWFQRTATHDMELHTAIATARCYLGEMYRRGLGVKRSRAEAQKWFIEASEWGMEDDPYVRRIVRDIRKSRTIELQDL